MADLNLDMIPATEVVMKAMLHAGLDTVRGMQDHDVIDTDKAIALTEFVSAGVKSFAPEEALKAVEVFKGLDYGRDTTDLAEMADGRALVLQHLQKRKEYHKALMQLAMERGFLPFDHGETEIEVMKAGFAEYLQESAGFGDDDAISMGAEMTHERVKSLTLVELDKGWRPSGMSAGMSAAECVEAFKAHYMAENGCEDEAEAEELAKATMAAFAAKA